MADVNRQAFSERVMRISEKSAPGGRVHKRIGKDGLVQTVVVKKRRLIPYHSIIVTALLVILTKGFILSEIGQPAYDQNLATMKNGSVGAIAAAFLLDDDRATIVVADTINRFRKTY